MFIHIQPTSSTPLYTQIIEQVRYAVASGAIKEGEKMPSVRELARTLSINPNTVAKAYHELEREKIVISQRGKGVFVAQRQNHLSDEEKERIVGEKLESALADAFNLGLTPKQITAVLKSRMEKFYGKGKK